ncbi:BsaWI family type II restriction enzyme [Propionimicrobium sp. BV2F7]|uniref:BsaWI family type II restriction enzyme n=1 Tax=Propionimicrobium sp. BV2F7 TaxID=1111131 RepID=UPI0003D798AE|nr:BsaWI family type II restriction enzyme [Propionimicrobium sp. BV2F7]ETJ98124.1 hypothetical protein HMPREF1255_1431 [Propionimicrobium sp. BV2F7]
MYGKMSPLAKALLNELRDIRLGQGKTPEQVESDLIIGPGWIEEIETGVVEPLLDDFLYLAHSFGKELSGIYPKGHQFSADAFPTGLSRTMRAIEVDGALEIHFKYSQYDATYILPGATLSEYEEVIRKLRDGLALLDAEDAQTHRQIKANAVTAAFLRGVSLWPDANPSDIWWFIIYRAYCEPFNHPAAFSRLSFDQSWKRTGGWALEKILVQHYQNALKQHDVNIEIVEGQRKRDLLDSLNIPERLESDKVDVYLTDDRGKCFGIVNVKASFAERRTDDVPMSQALIRAGYYSALWTMDCKSTPSKTPVNRGELGAVEGKRSAKRVDIEDDGLFSACFSYNRNTAATPEDRDAKARVIVCNFQDPNDAFLENVVAAKDAFKNRTSN